ncbi:MAG: hypothetical protein WD894_16750 [Pirellulales bacterium]
MKRRPTYGVFVISVDVAGDSAGVSSSNRSIALAEAAATLNATEWLRQLLDQYRLPATWFFADPGTSALRSQVVNAEMEHEVGLLVADDDSGSRTRFEFGQNLQRRLLAARATGLEISSLATLTARKIEHLDLLVKHGIRALRLGAANSFCNGAGPSGWAAVATLRFGISNLPTTLQAVDAPRWQRWIKAWERRRHILAAARQRQYCHLMLDIHTLANSGAREVLRQTLGVAARLARASQIQVETVSAVAASLLSQPSTPCAQSILRAA